MSGACQVHRYHWPKPLRTVVHHIQPLAMGGRDIPENRVTVCDTGHFNAHRCLDNLLKNEPFTGGTRRERALGQQGFDAWVADGKPGEPVFQLERFNVVPASRRPTKKQIARATEKGKK